MKKGGGFERAGEDITCIYIYTREVCVTVGAAVGDGSRPGTIAVEGGPLAEAKRVKGL